MSCQVLLAVAGTSSSSASVLRKWICRPGPPLSAAGVRRFGHACPVVFSLETKLSSLLEVDLGVVGRDALVLAFAGAAEGMLLVGRRIHAALTWSRSFTFVIWWVHVRCCPSRVIMAPQDM